jgi:2-oxoisovalerate dehydrogenase E1 component
MLPEVETAIEAAFDEEEIVCEVICPMQLYPFDARPVVDSVSRSGRLLIVEEGLNFAAFGAEVVSAICEQNPGALQMVKRIGAPRHPIPSCGPLEKELLQHEASIRRTIVEMLR